MAFAKTWSKKEPSPWRQAVWLDRGVRKALVRRDGGNQGSTGHGVDLGVLLPSVVAAPLILLNPAAFYKHG